MRTEIGAIAVLSPENFGISAMNSTVDCLTLRTGLRADATPTSTGKALNYGGGPCSRQMPDRIQGLCLAVEVAHRSTQVSVLCKDKAAEGSALVVS